MTLDDDAAWGFARLLRAAENEGSAVPLATNTFSGLDWHGARRIALARDDLRREDDDACIGYKLGWTSAAMRQALGIDRPNWGTLWRSQRLGTPLELAALRHAKVEPEIVCVAASRLQGGNVSAAEVIEKAAGWAIGIEVVSPRWESFDFTWLDNTADNSSAAAVAVGPVQQLDVEPATIEVSFSNGRETRTGLGDQAMGSPAEAVAWLARSLAVEGSAIEPGDLVFTGGLTAPFDVQAGSRYVASAPGLGSVDVAVSS